MNQNAGTSMQALSFAAKLSQPKHLDNFDLIKPWSLNSIFDVNQCDKQDTSLMILTDKSNIRALIQ